MRIHSNILTMSHFTDALAWVKDRGRVDAMVYFDKLKEHKSQTTERAFEMQLESFGKLEGDGRRARNSGAYGSRSYTYSATYDEWGWLLARLYQLDSDMICGSPTRPNYANSDDFHNQTGLTYRPLMLVPFLDREDDPYPYRAGRKQVGRYGAGRVHKTSTFSHLCTYDPRDVDEYIAFALPEGGGWR